MAMDREFEVIKPELIQSNIFKLIGDDWMLVCAGNLNKYNMMTASWGCCGVLWNKPIAISFIRPQRYTYEFVEKNEIFTLNFFDKTHRKLLNLLGTKSGRDIEKMKQPDLDAVESTHGGVYFKQARIVLECRKIYYDDLKPELFLSSDIEKMYPSKDYHRFYIGEILKSMIRP
jgi:flavin reductase (DIM6/NTAB) family NADH-FMN oxidoreductase RutF